MNDQTDQILGSRGNVKTVIAENTRNGHKRNHKATYPQNLLNAVFVVDNVHTHLAIVLIVIS